MCESVNDDREKWRAEYRAHRYLEHEPIIKLHDRAIAMTVNARAVDRTGKLYWRRGGQWFEMLTHTLEEFAFRKIVLPMPQPPKYAHAARAAELWDKVNVPNGSYILKFGRKQYIVDLIEKGRLRVQPAESYDDPSLNLAIADKEYEITEETVGATVGVPPPNRDYNVPMDQWEQVPILGTLKQIRTYTGRSYIACFGLRYEYQLFEDFGHDACAVIRDPMRFLHAAQDAGDKVLPGWQFAFDRVTYRDPFHPIKNDDVLYSKNFRYAYQREMRITWEHDPSLKGPLESVFLDLGPLAEYCDLLAL